MEDDSVDTGKVIKTDPTAGTTRKEGSSIDVYVSSGSKGFRFVKTTRVKTIRMPLRT